MAEKRVLDGVKGLPDTLLNLLWIVPDFMTENLKDFTKQTRIKRHVSLLEVFKLSYGEEGMRELAESSMSEEEISSVRCPFHFMPALGLQKLLTEQGREVRQFSAGAVLYGKQVVPCSAANLIRYYGYTPRQANLISNIIGNTYILKSKTDYVNVIGLAFENGRVLQMPLDNNVTIMTRDLKIWEQVAREWYESENEGLWSDLSMMKQRNILVNTIRHSTCYDSLCSLDHEGEYYADLVIRVNKLIAFTFPKLRTIALAQLDRKGV